MNKDYIIKAQKMLAKGFMFGHISNGNGLIDLGNNMALSFIAINEKFIEISIIEYGKDTVIKTQSWQKVKKIKEEKPKEEQVKIVNEVYEL